MGIVKAFSALTIEEAAEMMGVSVSTARRLVRSGAISAWKSRGRINIGLDTLERFLERKETQRANAERKLGLAPDAALLRKILRYEPATGRLYWRPRTAEMGPKAVVNPWNAHYAGKEALTHINKDGYFSGKILGRTYLAHRVIWAMEAGEWPPHAIDHINNNRSDNRKENLRTATVEENARNRTSRVGASSKYLGVSKIKRGKKWKASIYVNGKAKIIGEFDCEVAAAKAYDEQARKHFLEFANPNFP